MGSLQTDLEGNHVFLALDYQQLVFEGTLPPTLEVQDEAIMASRISVG